MNGYTLCLVSILLAVIAINALQIFPERTEVTFVNPKYIENITANVRRYNRKSLYYVNIDMTTLHTWMNNVTIQMILYEYLHNEYREGFVNVKYKLCDFLQLIRPFVLHLLKRYKLECPLKPGRYQLLNMTTEEISAIGHLPYKFPMEKGMLAILFRHESGERIVEGNIKGRAKD